MKIVNILGGLGNQLFEYAMYLALKDAHPEEDIKVCTRSFGGYRLHNGLEIKKIFGIDLPEASLFELTKLAYPFFNYKSWQLMRHWLPEKKSMTSGTTQISFDISEVFRGDSVFYDGYWQNEGYFKHIRCKVLEAYTFPAINDENNKCLAKRLSKLNAVSCHVRRGDYLQEPVMCVCTPAYYARAIEKMNSHVNPDMYVFFSDDIPWCKDNLMGLLGGREAVFVDWNQGEKSFRDIQLMTLCNHNIIANSSFSWWGAWLNQHEKKVVVAPEKWMNKPLVNDPICNEWIRV